MRIRAPTFYAWLSLGTSVATIALKFGAYMLTGSVGLLSDAVESIANIVAAMVALAALTYSAAEPDREHNFGHEKAEYFSSGIEGALIFVAAAAIVWSAVPRFLEPQTLEHVSLGLALSVLASAANAGCAWLMLRAAQVHRSITLEADAKHLLTDVWTTLGVLVGVVCVQLTGWLRLDPLIAIAVALQILWTGSKLVHRSFEGLMDRAIPEADRQAIVQILETLREQGGDYHELRTRMAGSKSFVDVHVLVPGALSVKAGHDLVESIEQQIRARLPHVDVLTHLEPLEQTAASEGARIDLQKASG
jgi:cation diffusion facilitator family transporter